MRDVRPGEMVVAKDGDVRFYQLSHNQCPAHCVFEYIYFARPDSIMDGRLVYDVRVRIGSILAEEHSLEADTVTPVPDSGITFAIGYHQRSNIKYRECLMKTRYIGRTFLMPGRSRRDRREVKLNTNPP